MGISEFFSNGSDDNQKSLDFESFKNREIKAKQIFKIRESTNHQYQIGSPIKKAPRRVLFI
jgi:hypothetical protein